MRRGERIETGLPAARRHRHVAVARERILESLDDDRIVIDQQHAQTPHRRMRVGRHAAPP